jgi:hypothetical protein
LYRILKRIQEPPFEYSKPTLPPFSFHANKRRLDIFGFAPVSICQKESVWINFRQWTRNSRLGSFSDTRIFLFYAGLSRKKLSRFSNIRRNIFARDLNPAFGKCNRNASHYTLSLNLKVLFENRRIELPDSIDIVSSLNSVIMRRSRSGDYLFSHDSGTHDDLACALGLAISATAKESSGSVFIVKY